ncbi:uncharacterized protein PFL1_01853 [Pseudozyma flocculosa PF-1]|uniref:uncharacterized protein n=1 Tax=Pseudozyma flocculosa PF-1 TaxID=1277687 RepID=UPI0004560C40|nr:uncharacterized protein PFL1_01853 [Pseudozyma flocculosa PF-1]EPQ30327.1 hypothetical protein PFL1_01853 [Pseudozyma flocculosa PF-1]
MTAAAAHHSYRRPTAATPSTTCAAPSASALLHQQTRSLFGLSLFGAKKPKDDAADPFAAGRRKQPILSQDNLFHPFSQSPIPAIRARGERIRSLAPCPVSMAKYKQRRLVNFECPDCGWPTHFSEKEWQEDTEHPKYVARLREANEDEHDLRSGRDMNEFKLPGPQGFEETINMSSWDVFFYTRNFNSIESDRSRRHVSKLLTFPTTVGAVIHENSPYTKRSRRLTHEGLRSMIALRQTLHPKAGDKPSLDVMRIFVVGARAEASLPPAVWDQLTYMFPNVPFHVYLIGPEAPLPGDGASSNKAAPTTTQQQDAQANGGSSDNNSNNNGGGSGSISMHKGRTRKSNFGVPSRTVVVSEGLTITTIQSKYEEVHAQFEPFDPYTDVFFAFSPGFGFPSQVAVEEADRARQEGRDDPAGGDVPAQEPAPIFSSPRGDSFTALTAAPVVQAQREWAKALGQILSTRCALVATGFSPADVERDVLAFESVEGVRGEFDWLITPGENVFASQQWAVADFDPRVAVKANWGLWAVRGKRYDIQGPTGQ